MKTTNFWQYFSQQTRALEDEGRWGTSINYSKVQRSFQTFCNNGQLQIREVTPKLVASYNRWLYSKGLVRNSVSQYNRVLRAVYNRAVRERLTSDKHPFDRVYTGIDTTCKRALPEGALARMARVPSAEGNELARDLFLFSFATCGMTFVDMVYLKKSCIAGDSVVYYRRKTGGRIQLRLEPLAQGIIRKYARRTPDSPYVFPILGNTSGRTAYHRFLSALTAYNRELKALASEAGISRNISSYVPRHSWATAAWNNGADISMVSEALGHKSEKTTRIYLASFDTRKIERVNQKLLKKLLINN